MNTRFFLRHGRQVGFLSSILLLILARTAQAGSATWNLNPSSNDWHTAGNWNPATVPNDPADTATFAISNTTDISVTETTTLDSLVFSPGASAFTINADANSALNFRGAGIINNSGIMQSFVAGPQPFNRTSDIIFAETATAGDFVSYSVSGGIFDRMIGGEVVFRDHATAGDANFIVEPSEVVFEGRVRFEPNSNAGTATFTLLGGGYDQVGGSLSFAGSSSAAHAVITCQGAVADTAVGGSEVLFFGLSGAGNALITAEGGSVAGAPGGVISFLGTSTAEKAFLSASGNQGAGTGGQIIFLGNAQGGAAAVNLSDAGELFVESYDPTPGITIGTLTGNGTVNLMGKNLTVGTIPANSGFDGVIQDNGVAGGSFTKVGSGTFRLSAANTYTGGTTVKQGVLLATNTTGSATGTGDIQVQAGILGGSGIISGTVTLGTGTGSGAALEPSFRFTGVGPMTLTIQSLLTFNADSAYTYKLQVKGQRLQSDNVIANGVIIQAGAQFDLVPLGNGILSQGSVVNVISNTATTPISGTFANLPDGATITAGNNTFQANYEGGDGNDLTLTVVL